MKVEGFELFLEDYCSYCPNFEPEIDKIDVTRLGEAPRYINNIRCMNRQKCARIAENLDKKKWEKQSVNRARSHRDGIGGRMMDAMDAKIEITAISVSR